MTDFKRVVIDTLDCMVAANGFYPRMGFRKVEWWPYFPNTLFSILTQVEFCRWEYTLPSKENKFSY